MRGGSRATIGLALVALLAGGACSSTEGGSADAAPTRTTVAPARPVTEAQLRAFADDRSRPRKSEAATTAAVRGSPERRRLSGTGPPRITVQRRPRVDPDSIAPGNA